jgi:hypothetical protein
MLKIVAFYIRAIPGLYEVRADMQEIFYRHREQARGGFIHDSAFELRLKMRNQPVHASDLVVEPVRSGSDPETFVSLIPQNFRKPRFVFHTFLFGNAIKKAGNISEENEPFGGSHRRSPRPSLQYSAAAEID